MTTQEIFDTVARHLLTQGARSMVPDGPRMCAYRGAEGRKCAVGVLIKDEFYRPALERQGMTPVVKRAVEKSVGRELTQDEEDLLQVLQAVHDSNETCYGAELVAGWRVALLDVARRWELSAEVLG